MLDNLNFTQVKLVCIPYNKEYTAYRLEDMLRKDYPSLKFNFIRLDKNTRGAAETLHIALSKLKNEGIEDAPFLLLLDGDNFYTIDIISNWQGRNKIFTVHDKESAPIYSFVKVSNHNKIETIVEKPVYLILLALEHMVLIRIITF